MAHHYRIIHNRLCTFGDKPFIVVNSTTQTVVKTFKTRRGAENFMANLADESAKLDMLQRHNAPQSFIDMQTRIVREIE